MSRALDEKVQELGADGFVGFHMQDTDGAGFRGDLYLAFRGADESRDLQVPAVACAVLRECGVQCQWSGEFSQKILATLAPQDRALFDAAARYEEEGLEIEVLEIEEEEE